MTERQNHPYRQYHKTSPQVRSLISKESARIIYEEGLNDFQSAKNKALKRLNLSTGVAMPSNQEIEAALIEHVALFGENGNSALTREWLQIALEMMTWLELFSPRLAGSLVRRPALVSTPIELHLFSESIERVLFFFIEDTIPHEVSERRLRFGKNSYKQIPLICFMADEAAVELLIFSSEAKSEPPLSPVDGNPMERLGVRKVEKRINEIVADSIPA